VHLSALWTSLFDPEVDLDEARKKRVLARARQTFGLRQSDGVFFRRNRRNRRNRRRPRLAAAILLAGWLFFLLAIASRGFLFVWFMIVVFLLAAESLGGFPFIEWLCRPALVRHVRQAMLDLGYDEVCWRCGYRLENLPREIVQCPECGAVRERPREIPKWQLALLDEIAPDPEGSADTMSHDA